MIEYRNVTVSAGPFRMERVNLHVPDGAYGVLMGRTGSGKTTLLEAAAGLKPALAGQILLDGRDVTDLKPAERNIGYVPQDGALFTHMTARENLAFALRVRRAARDHIDRRVKELAQLLNIEPLLDRRPATFSGGEKQRVALGRALAFGPATLVMDEPLTALDDETCAQMHDLLDRVRAHTNVTALHVTHSMAEAERLADVLFRIEDGSVVQVDGAQLSRKRPTTG